MIPRVVPALLVDGGDLVKTVRFADARYVGDPINAVRIFNDKEADELVLLDIAAARSGRAPVESMIAEVASEAFMPVAYGGGVRDLDTATRLIQLGVEKVVVNSAAVDAPDQVAEIAGHLGSSTLVISIDAKARPDGGFEVFTHGGTVPTGLDVRDHARRSVDLGAGELLLTSMDREGTRMGYDLELVRSVTELVDVPVVACGGAGELADLVAVVGEAGAAAAAAGSLFVFHGKHQAVLITYPSYAERVALFRGGGPPA